MAPHMGEGARLWMWSRFQSAQPNLLPQAVLDAEVSSYAFWAATDGKVPWGHLLLLMTRSTVRPFRRLNGRRVRPGHGVWVTP